MRIYSKVTEQHLINLRKLAEQQKNQRATENKNRILKQTHDRKIAENLAPITTKLDQVNESTKKLAEIVKKIDVEGGNTQKPAQKNITGTQLLHDTLTLTRIKKFFQLE